MRKQSFNIRVHQGVGGKCTERRERNGLLDINICSWFMIRVGQKHIYTENVRYIWQGNHQIYGHRRCIYTVLANPIYDHDGTTAVEIG